jgi:hypothetical protein
MELERLPAGWELEAALREANDLPSLVRAKLEAGLLTAVDGIMALTSSAHDERVKLLACREIIALAQQLAAVELDPVSDLMRQVFGEARRLSDDGR